MGIENTVELAAGFNGTGELARLAQLDELAAQLRKTAVPENTRRSYATAWRLWLDYTHELCIPATANTEGALVGFVGWYARHGVRPDTIRARLAAIYSQLGELGVEPARLVKKHVAQSVKDLEKEQIQRGTVAPAHKAPILADGHLEAMVTAQPDTLRGLRDTAVLTMWFGLARRRSELAVQKDRSQATIGLMVSDITVDSRGMTTHIRVSKTGAGTVMTPWQLGSPLCPVAAWTKWRRAAGITEGPAFRRLHPRYDTLLARGIGDKGVRNIITRAEQLAGLDAGYTGHSGRRTFVTRAVDAGAGLNEICAVTLHVPGSRTVHEYYEVRDRWTQNPLSRIV